MILACRWIGAEQTSRPSAPIRRPRRLSSGPSSAATASYRTYAELSLERAGIASSFAHVFTRAELLVGDTKQYRPVLERVGGEPKDLLIVGDVYQRDRAADHPRIPMIVQPHGWKEPASPLLPLIRALRREDDFLAGWERLFAEATLEGRKRRIMLEGVSATIDRWGPAQPEPTPVIVELSASTDGGEA